MRFLFSSLGSIPASPVLDALTARGVPVDSADLPSWAPFAALGALAAVGAALWIKGATLLKPFLALVGVLAGAWGGFTLAQALLPGPILGAHPSFFGVALGALGGLALASIAFRLAMAWSGAAVGAGLGLIVACGVIAFSVGGIDAAIPESAQRLPDTFANDVREAALARLAPGTSNAEGVLLHHSRDEMRNVWANADAQTRGTLVVGLGAGAVLGLLAGSLFPTRIAAGLTAALGAAAVLLAAGLSALRLGHLTSEQWMNTGVWWGVAWIALAVTGATLQLAKPVKSTTAAAPPQAQGAGQAKGGVAPSA